MVKCMACGRFASDKGDVTRCSKCLGIFHRPCVGLSETSRVGASWSCPGCKPKKPKGDNAETPVKALHSEGSGDEDKVTSRQEHQASPSQPEATFAIVAANAAAAAEGVTLLRRELAECVAEMRDFRREMAEHRALVASVDARMEAVEQRLEELERREAGPPSPSADVTELERTVAQLKQELGDRDQEALLSDLEIGHLPEERGENTVHAVTVLATRLGISLDARDIVYAERVGAPPTPGGNSSGGSGAARSRRVVVRLARRSLRDELLRAARVRRALTVADAGGADTAPRGRIFLNERLTRANRQLFHRVREECRKLQWRYSWTRQGRIFARQADGRPAYQIKSDTDFQRVFGLESV